ncbi:caspase, EACC1-associated type [Streptomyces sp. enrichment culture]|uniref:caspase family protein n=1 Tax=Streptomyces sp. enrichment culture TaxID=1795815 RepID=UPI003F58022F
MTTLPDPAASRAVLVGVDTYTRPLEPLPAVADNLVGFREVLTGPDSWHLPPEHCTVLRNPASATQVLDAVHAAATEATDALLVYFAGHGLLSPAGDLYLALPDSTQGRLFRAVDYDQVRHLVAEECAALSRVVVLDCCYSGRALHGYMGTGSGPADDGAIDGTYVLTASAETKRAMAPRGERHTAFSGALLKTLTEGVPHGPEVLDTESVHRHVWKELRARNRPLPQQRARNGGHRIALARNRWSPAPGPEAQKYAAALRRVVPEGARTADTDTARLLRGEGIAPRAFVDSLADHLSEAELGRLHTLRRAAQRAAADPATRLLYWQEEVEVLTRRLAHAGDYSRGIEDELTQAKRRVELLDVEVGVLRRQVRTLLEEKERHSGAEDLVDAAVSAPEAAQGRGAGPARTPASRAPSGQGGAPAARPPASLAARTSRVLAVLAVVYVVTVWALTLDTVALTYASGRKPASTGAAPDLGSGDGPRYVWDAETDLESTFRPEEDDAVDRLEGGLTVSVPGGCADRTVEWEISADGRRLAHGSLTGEVEHTVPVDLPLDRSPERVTVAASWDGGAGTCESFGVVWEDPRLADDFDLVPW